MPTHVPTLFSKDNFSLLHIDTVIDNIVNKYHLIDLRKLFKRLVKYRLRLNPNKCVFRANSKKLLGFIINYRGIEVDLTKV